MFHLGIFSSIAPYTWRSPYAGRARTEWTDPRYYAEVAESLERGGFDAIVFEDSSQVVDTYQGTMEYGLRTGTAAPKLDPVCYAGVIARRTRHIGIIPTVATTFYPPFLLARLMATLDHLTGGRVGANLVTGSTHLAAQNYGLDRQVEHDERYAMADEWAELVRALWGSWEPDAIVADSARRMFADPAKVHAVDFQGRWYRSAGPLNTAPSPQGRPVLCQAGGSPAGRDFAAKHADIVVSAVLGVEAMKAYREDMSARMRAVGRDPSELKVLYLVQPVLGETEAQAKDRKARKEAMSDAVLEDNLFWMSYYSGVDFGAFDLDAPMPDVAARVNGHRSTMADYATAGAGRTLRELASTHNVSESVELVGTPDSVAAQMEEVMAEAGGDGFLLTGDLSRRRIAELTDGLSPALRRRGLIRDGYDSPYLRDNLLAF